MRMILIALFVLLAGCASTGRNYDKTLSSWFGHPITDLIASWGAPTSTTTLPDGSNVYEFVRQESSRNITSDGAGGMLLNNALECRTTFITDAKGIIQRYVYKGNVCY